MLHAVKITFVERSIIMCRKLAYFVLILGLAAGLTNAKPLNQDPGPDGIISFEAENFDRNVEVGGHSWVETGPTGGFTGIIGMPVSSTSQEVPDKINSKAMNTKTFDLDLKLFFVKSVFSFFIYSPVFIVFCGFPA